MSSLPSDLRSTLEKAIITAREVGESAAEAAFAALAIRRSEPFSTMSTEQRRLRIALRARARQLGNGSMDQGYPQLIEEVAYEQWHRMLFARFLAENNLLIHPSGVAVTLRDCAELAPEEGETDAWQLAARYASAMLPGIFRLDDPAVQVRFAPEGHHKLERTLTELSSLIFRADDALGWIYQFWQTKKKQEVNASGRKVGGEDLAPVTQLFTEDYMVRFLLENSLGAWWAARHPQSPLLKRFTYLRFRDDGIPAAGTFPGWPERAAEVTVMDPCCGSGHFLVAAFEMLRYMRMEEEGLSEREASDAVLRDNLFGLELDPRCTQIAAFALAFAAWKAGGFRTLPLPNIACSGIPVEGQLEEWTKLAGKDVALKWTLERLYDLFRNAPDLGSLINPADVPIEERMFAPDYTKVEPLLEQMLAKERAQDDPVAAVFGAAAEGVARAAKLLTNTYTLIATNVPYLGLKKQGSILKQFCELHFPDAKMDLATVFVERCRMFSIPGGTYAVITPQNWHFLGSYLKLRRRLLSDQTWNIVANLGPKAFQTPMWDFNIGLSILTNWPSTTEHKMAGIEALPAKTPQEKAALLQEGRIRITMQSAHFRNPNSAITLSEASEGKLLEYYAVGLAGILCGDAPRFRRCFWEVIKLGDKWKFEQGTVKTTQAYGGREGILLWENGQGQLRELAKELQERLHDADRRGNQAWGKMGVAVSSMGTLPATLYTGELFDNNTAVILPKKPEYLPAIWSFCQSPEYNEAVRRIDNALKVTNASLVRVPFNLEQWQLAAEEAGPLPEPYSNDPTQWLFEGNPDYSTEPLQVAVTRLLGYNWPHQESDKLDLNAVKEGIVCLPPVAGEPPAAERLRVLLAAAYGDKWSHIEQERLLTAAGFGGAGLDGWLRDGFFAQHCKLFHSRPFIWHIWDGRKDGFSALVNYHQLDVARLNKLIYTYLGAWIDAQRTGRDAGVAGADGRLVAAIELQKKLEAIREGEPPYDIYVRWKPLHQQPIGWNPDLNDGVRLNIRPFVQAGVLRSKFTINWNKDRGTNPDGTERLNDLHYTRAEKLAARKTAEATIRA